jgi:hypothetical protein
MSIKVKAGAKFGNWTIISEEVTIRRNHSRHRLCACVCGEQKLVQEFSLINGVSNSCGCKKAEKRQVKTIDDIFDRCLPEPNSGCWIWMGTLNHGSEGYGIAHSFYHSRKIGAHRLSLSLVKPYPTGARLEACHKCDVTCCVNPDHLFWGTRSDNMRDASRKGRGRTPRFAGVANPATRLTRADVINIRQDLRPRSVVAQSYGLSAGSISAIRNSKTFKEIP